MIFDIIKIFVLLSIFVVSTYLFCKIPTARRSLIPIRYPKIGDKVTFISENAYNGINGIVDWVSNDKQSYSINTGNSILIIPDRNYFGKVLPDKYFLHEESKVYRNR